MTNRSYKPQKQLSALPMAASQMSGQGEQQQQQPTNHSSENAETARCLILFSYPAVTVQTVYGVGCIQNRVFTSPKYF